MLYCYWKYPCDFTYKNHKNPFLEHCIAIQSVSVRTYQIWTSKIASARWDQALVNWWSIFLIKGTKQERRATVCSTSFVAVHSSKMTAAFFPVKNDISYYNKWYFLEEIVIFWAAVFPKWGNSMAARKLTIQFNGKVSISMRSSCP
jgi:hypothetical protein